MTWNTTMQLNNVRSASHLIFTKLGGPEAFSVASIS